MRKIISSILIVAMMLSLFTTVSFAASSGVGIDEEVALLQKLDIIEEGVPELDKAVTRAEFVKLLANFLKIDYSAKIEERYYIDVAEEEELWNITGQLVNYAILTVPDNRRFRPDDIILQAEAACALMKGYGAGTLEYKMYSEIASRMDLLENVSYGELKYKDVINLLYNALVGYPLTFTGNGIAPGDRTYMEIYYDMFYVKGVVNAVNDSVIDGNGSGRTESIRVGNLLIDCDVDNPYQYLGKRVGVFYTSEDDPQLFYIYSITDDEDVITITQKNYPEFDEQSFTIKYYNENDKLKTIRLPQTVNVIFNGENVTNDVKGAFDRFTVGEITVISSGSGDENDTVIIESYKNLSVMSVNATEGLIYGKDGTLIDVSTDSRPVYIEDINGNELSLESIANGSIASVYESDVYLRIVISNTIITGSISGIESNDDNPKLTVAGTEYELFPGKQFVYALGNQVSLYLDHNGYVAEITTERKDGMLYGWITRYYISDDLGDEGVYLKVFKEDGTFAKLLLAEKTRIDGVTRKTPDLQIFGLEQGKSGVIDQMILFKANEDNVVKEIDTIFPNSTGEGLVKEFSNAEGTYGSSSVGKLIWATTATIVFVLPSAENHDIEEAYAIGTQSLLAAWGTNDVDSYRSVDHDKPAAAEVLVLRRDMYTAASGQKGAFIVEGLHQEWDQDEDVVNDVVTLMSGSATKEYVLAKNFTGKDDLVKGNIITIGLNGKNQLSTITLLYGTDGNGNVFNAQKEVGGWSDALHYIAIGKVIAVGDDYADLSITGDDVPTVRFPISTTNIGVFEVNERHSCRVGTKGDIAKAMMRGDVVALSMNRGTMLSIAIVKN